MKKQISIFLCIIMLMSSFSFADVTEEYATIFYEAINVQGTKLSSMDINYPLLNYNGVTYIPLSWKVNRHLGLAQTWDEASNTLDLSKTDDSTPVERPFESNYYASQKVEISISDVSLTLDGEPIEFGEYPLIEYEHVQYIPLTWDFVSNQLEWDINWNENVGLVLLKDKEEFVEPDEKKLNGMISFMQSINKNLSLDEAARYTRLVVDASDKYGVSETWIMAMFWQESNFDAYCSSGGAIGAMQIMESTGRAYGLSKSQLLVPEINIDFGVKYLSGLRSYYSGDLTKGTLAYNQGTTRVNRGTSRSWYLNDIVEKEARIITYLNEVTSQ